MWSKISSQDGGCARDPVRMISTEGSKRNAFQFLKAEIHHQGFIKAIRWNQAFNLPLGIQHLLRGHSEGEQGASALEHSLWGNLTHPPSWEALAEGLNTRSLTLLK